MPNALPGKYALVQVGVSTASLINDATFAINGEIVDISAFGEQGFRRTLQNLIDADITISGFYDPDDTDGQVALRSAVLNQDSVNVSVLPDGTSGFSCDAFVESFEVTTGVEGAVEVSISMQSDGEITVT